MRPDAAERVRRVLLEEARKYWRRNPLIVGNPPAENERTGDGPPSMAPEKDKPNG